MNQQSAFEVYDANQKAAALSQGSTSVKRKRVRKDSSVRIKKVQDNASGKHERVNSGGREVRGGRGGSRGGRGMDGVKKIGFRGGDRGRGRGLRRSLENGGERGTGWHPGGGIGQGRGKSRGRGKGGGHSKHMTAKRPGRENMGRPVVRGKYQEYCEYPGWSTDEIHWLLQEMEYCRFRRRNMNWRKVSSVVKRHSPQECKQMSMSILESVKPTCQFAIDCVKSLFMLTIPRHKEKQYKVFKKQPKSLYKIYMEIEREKNPDAEGRYFRKTFHALSDTKKAEYYIKHWQAVKRCDRARFHFYKKHPHIFNKLSNIESRMARNEHSRDLQCK